MKESFQQMQKRILRQKIQKRITEAKRICAENGVFHGLSLHNFYGITSKLPNWRGDRHAVAQALYDLKTLQKFI